MNCWESAGKRRPKRYDGPLSSWRSPCTLTKTLWVTQTNHNPETQKNDSNSLKSVASRWNPDKTDAYWLFQGDPAAHEKFLQVNRAYEVLKDEDLRKKYDKYGEKGLDEQQGGRYESWNYYRYDFGK